MKDIVEAITILTNTVDTLSDSLLKLTKIITSHQKRLEALERKNA